MGSVGGGLGQGDVLVAGGLLDAQQRDQNTEWGEDKEVLQRRWAGGVGAFTISPDGEGEGRYKGGQGGGGPCAKRHGYPGSLSELEELGRYS